VVSVFRISILLAASALISQAQSGTFRWIRQIGGSGTQSLAGIATDTQGNTYAAGSTTSLDFPVQNAIQPHPAASGLFRIDGAGSSWQNLYQAGLSAATTVTADPRDPRIIYATGATDIHRSADAGATWTLLATLSVTTINGFAIDPTNSGVLYAASVGQGMLKSIDGGATWTAIDNGIAVAPDSVLAVRGIWIDPNHPSVLFTTGYVASGYTLIRSADAGATWQPLADPAVSGLDTVSFDPFTPGKVYATSDLRSAFSTDDGLTWSALAPVDSTWQPFVILPDPNHPGVLYAGAEDALWKSVDGGMTWTRKGESAAPMLALDRSTGAIYAAFGYHIVVTTDGFDTTTAIGPPALPGISALAAAGGRLFVGESATTDVFVVKYDSQGNVLFATYFGGSSTDVASAMTVDSAGAVYVTGTTQSLDFPATPGAYAKSGNTFLFKLNPDGSLAWSTYFAAQPNAIAVDSAGHAYIAGITGGNMPTTPGGYQPNFNGTFCGIGCLISIPPTNGFLAEFDSAGASLIFSTYLGVQNESAAAVMLLPDSSAVVAGQSVLYHLNPTGSSLIGTKPVAGSIAALAPAGAGNILAAGATQSASFAATPGAFQTALYPQMSLPGTFGNSGAGDAFVMRLDAQLNVLTSTLLGGEAPDTALSVAAGPGGTILAGGSTYSQAFPTRGAIQSSFYITTGFLSQLTSDLSTLLFSTYTGDTRPFYVRSVTAAPDGGILFGGTTGPIPYGPAPFSTSAANAIFPNSGSQAFVVRVDLAQPSAPRIDSVVNAASQLGVPLSPRETIQIHGASFGDDAVLLLNGDALPLLAHDHATLTAAIPPDFAAAAATIEADSGAGRATILVPGAAVSPGIFSRDGTGVGAGYIFNKDGTPNSPDNPAKEGDPITICATGVGSLSFNQGYAVTDAFVDVLVDGFEAAGIAAILGPVAGLPGGVYQISVYVPRPSDYASSNPNLLGFVLPPQVAVTLRVNSVFSQAGLALYVTH
jgi:uncharacterized protein (TIGR03437 family)